MADLARGHDGVIVFNYPGLDKRAMFGPGPWENEPDRVEWNVGPFACLARRVYNGVWAGYVGLPEGHPWWGECYEDIPARGHGLLNYASESDCDICHLGASAPRYWIGFDCGHARDRSPADALLPFAKMPGAEYRTIEYVMSKVEELAKQCEAAARLLPEATDD